MSDKERTTIDYIVACVNDFSERHGMSRACFVTLLNRLGKWNQAEWRVVQS